MHSTVQAFEFSVRGKWLVRSSHFRSLSPFDELVGVVACAGRAIPRRSERALLSFVRYGADVLILAWTIFVLLFLLELVTLVVIGAYVWSQSASTGRRVASTVLAVIAVVAVWAVFASPDNPVDNPWVTGVVKVVVFAMAAAAVWKLFGRVRALTFTGAVILINGLALVPVIRETVS